MLIEIRSEKFREHTINFHSGLNVILGDDNATNSIGKSSLLMVIDFMLGGDSLLEHNRDLVIELGHHSYIASFKFCDKIYSFSRATDQKKFVFRMDGDQVGDPMPVERYRAFLRASYNLSDTDISFRSLVGLYFRVWGKENANDVHHPLHLYKSQSPRECVDNLIKTFGRYYPIKALSEDLERAEAEKRTLRAAIRSRHLPAVSRKAHTENVENIEKIEKEIEDIKNHLALYAANINQVVNRDVLDLKERKDRLLAALLTLRARLIRVNHNIDTNRHIKDEYFTGILEYFPNVDADRLARVEEFHNGVAKLLRSELLESRTSISRQVEALENEVGEIDRELARKLSSVDQPSAIIDRVYRLSKDWTNAKSQNRTFEKTIALNQRIKELGQELSDQKQLVIAEIQRIINDGLRSFVDSAFGTHRKSPTLVLEEKNYEYNVFDDTGTGVAYSALVMFDLVVFLNTNLPLIGHDSLLFKNVENDSVAKLFALYNSTAKQSFVAIDEINKYGLEASELLRQHSVIQLRDDAVLYIKDWRNKPM